MEKPKKQAKKMRVRRNPAVMWKRLGTEIVTLDRNTNRYHVLNAAASIIFEAATGELEEVEIAAMIAREFNIDVKAALEDVEEAIAGMVKLGLVETSGSPKIQYEKPNVKEITEKDFSESVAHGADIACRSMLGC